MLANVQISPYPPQNQCLSGCFQLLCWLDCGESLKCKKNQDFESSVIVMGLLRRLRGEQTSSGLEESLRNFGKSSLSCTFLKRSLTVFHPKVNPLITSSPTPLSSQRDQQVDASARSPSHKLMREDYTHCHPVSNDSNFSGEFHWKSR